LNRDLIKYGQLVDVTRPEDDPYDDWEVTPMEKFREELLNAGFKNEELYKIDFDKEEGILVDYDLFPHEVLDWDNNERIYKVRLKYTPLLKFKKALKDLGIMYDEEYWGE